MQKQPKGGYSEWGPFSARSHWRESIISMARIRVNDMEMVVRDAHSADTDGKRPRILLTDVYNIDASVTPQKRQKEFLVSESAKR